MKKSILALLGIATLVSCGTIKPEAPEISVQEEVVVPKQPVSVIKVPIKINLAPYFEATDKSVPTEFRGSDYQCQGVSYSYYMKRKKIDFTGVGERIDLTVKGGYSVKLQYCPECTSLFSSKGNCIIPITHFSCGVNEPLRKLEVSFRSKIGVQNDYHLKAKTEINDVKALSPCQVTMFYYDASSTLEKEVKKAMKSVSKDIDKEIAKVDLGPDMKSTWSALEEPIDLDGYGYMFLNPTKVGMSDIKYYGDTAYLDAYLQAFPQVRLDTIGFRPTDLPNLSKFDVTDGFDIKMDVTATYDSLSTLLTRSISGMKTDMKGNEVIFDSVQIHGAANQQLHIKLDFSGKKKGSLYLTGTPVFDAEKQKISFPDLEFDVKTRSALLKGAKWLFDKKITTMIREAATIELTEYLESFKGTIDESLNGEIDAGVQMNGKVNTILIDYILPREDALYMRVSSIGTLGIQM